MLKFKVIIIPFLLPHLDVKQEQPLTKDEKFV